MKLAIHGATGRMGLTVARLAKEAGIQIVGASCESASPDVGRDIGELAGVGPLGVVATDDVASSLLGADVVIDFSIASAVPALAAAAAREGVAVVSGTTNLAEAELTAVDRAAQAIPFLWAPNMSFGVQVLAELVKYAVEKLGDDYDPEIVEIHHRRKVDAPSGTAKRLARAVQEVRALSEMHGRSGHVGERTDGEIGVFGVRGGDVVGDHTVHLLGPGERLELTHRATSRDLFAHGALRAARFVVGKAPGRYTIADILGD